MRNALIRSPTIAIRLPREPREMRLTILRAMDGRPVGPVRYSHLEKRIPEDQPYRLLLAPAA